MPSNFARSLLAVVVLAALAVPAFAQNATGLDMQQVKDDTNWLAGLPSRVVGTDGHDQAVKGLIERVDNVKADHPDANIRIWHHRFSLVVPEVESATLTFAGEKHRVYPIWPALSRLNDTPPERPDGTGGISGELIYIGQGQHEEMPARILRGQIAVMEMTGQGNWKNAWNAGASAIVLLGSKEVTQVHAQANLSLIPLSIPRFYVPDGPLADALRNSERTASTTTTTRPDDAADDAPRFPPGKLLVKCRWKRTETPESQATNIYALLGPRTGARALVVAVPYDSMSVVGELAPGADVAIDAAVALNMLRYFAANPPARPVLFAFIDGYAINQLGMREMLGALNVLPDERETYIDDDRDTLEEYSEHLSMVERLEKIGFTPEVKAAYENLLKRAVEPFRAEIEKLEAEQKNGALSAEKQKRLESLRAKAAAAQKPIIDNRELFPEMHTLGERDYKDLWPYIQDEVNREVIAIELDLHPRRLRLPGLDGEAREREQKVIDVLQAERTGYFASEGDLTGDDPLEPGIYTKILALWQRAKERIRGQLDDAERRIGIQETRKTLRTELIQELRLDNASWPTAYREQIKLARPLLEQRIAKIQANRDAEVARIEAKLAERQALHQRVLAELEASSLNAQEKADLREREVEAFQEQSGRLKKESEAAKARAAGLVKLLGDTMAEDDRLLGLEDEDIRDDLEHDQDEVRPLEFVLGLDLSDAGVSVGPRLYCSLQKWRETNNAGKFTRWLRGVKNDEASQLWPGELIKAVNFEPLNGLVSAESYTVGNASNITSPTQSFGVYGATWATLDCIKPRVDTPNDTADAIDWARVEPQAQATFVLVRRMVATLDFNAAGKVVPKWSRVKSIIVDQSPGEPIPRLPMQGYLTVLVNGSARGGSGTVASDGFVEGVRLNEFRFSGMDGRCFFDLMPANVHKNRQQWFLQTYQFDETGNIVRAIDMNKLGKGLRVDVNVSDRNPSLRRGVVFTCQHLSVVDLFDPRFLIYLPSNTVLDARRGGRPQRLNVLQQTGNLSCMLEPGTRWQLLMRAGTTDNRLVLINFQFPKGYKLGDDLTVRNAMRGYRVDQRMDYSPVEQSVRDLYKLNSYRRQNYEDAGISAKPINDIHNQTGKDIKQLDDIKPAPPGEPRRGGDLHSKASEALASEIRAYHALQVMANDVVRAAIFLLLALVPFSFAMERLLVATPHIYRQLGAIVLIFAIMTGILWSFHPAFKISNQPLMIIMAFGIIFMSLLVMSIIYQKFRGQLDEMRSGRAESSGARTSRMGLVGAAVRLGIANMRKRKLRTFLTGATIVLITFALLCFTSVSSYVGHKEMTIAGSSPYTGVLLHQPQNRPMPPEAYNSVAGVLREGQTPVPRYWLVEPLDPQWRVHARNPVNGKQLSFNAGLGLASGEENLTGVDRVLPNWQRFVSEGGCYVSLISAERLVPIDKNFVPFPTDLLPLNERERVSKGISAADAVGVNAERRAALAAWAAALPNDWPLDVPREHLPSEGDTDEQKSAKLDALADWVRSRLPVAGEDEDTTAAKESYLRDWDLARMMRWLAERRAEGKPVILTIAGQDLPLVGVFEASRFNNEIRTMTGEALTPIDYSALGEEQRALLQSMSLEQMASEMASGAGMEPDQGLQPLSADSVVVVPASLMRSIPAASLRSIAISTTTMGEARNLARQMAQRVAFPVYYGSPHPDPNAVNLEGKEAPIDDPGVVVVASTALSPAGSKSLLITLVIAGLIIFNTMLNSIAERKREIHIYTSLGLAPVHVGVLFVAEAITYGLMGAIFGYVVGQGVATGLNHFDLLGGITLNYSGTQAIATMFLVLVVVVLSALVPAFMAGKIASPSEDMKWAVPEPVDDVIADTLPFTVTANTANGVAMFLHDYMDAHKEGSIGHFSTDNLQLVRRQIDGQDLLGVEATVWLAPYDLGVRQVVTVLIRPTDEDNVLEIDVTLRREAGQTKSWWKLNRVFLGDLRRQLLGWRKLRTERVLEYIADGRKALPTASVTAS